jgi:ubiquitin
MAPVKFPSSFFMKGKLNEKRETDPLLLSDAQSRQKHRRDGLLPRKGTTRKQIGSHAQSQLDLSRTRSFDAETRVESRRFSSNFKCLEGHSNSG